MCLKDRWVTWDPFCWCDQYAKCKYNHTRSPVMKPERIIVIENWKVNEDLIF